MNKKILGIFVVTLMIGATVVPVLGVMDVDKSKVEDASANIQTITLIPTGDATVIQSEPTKRTGHEMVLNVKTWWGGLYECRTYVQFDLSQIPVSSSQVNSAILRLYRYDTAIHLGDMSIEIPHHAFHVKSSWDESTIRWSYKPKTTYEDHWPFGDTCASCKIKRDIMDDGWKEWDVTSCLRSGHGEHGWMIKHSLVPNEAITLVNSFSFTSKESYDPSNDHRPQLVVTYGGDGPSDDMVEITQPEPLWIYLNGKKLSKISFPEEANVAVILAGGLQIRANAYSSSGINRVEFKLGDMNGRVQESIDYSEPYEWDWTDTPGFNIYELNARAFDNAGGSGEDNFLMIKLR